jgi:hypothetical protein
VRITTSIICGTDLHILKGDLPAVVDGRMSSEVIGIVSSCAGVVLSWVCAGAASFVVVVVLCVCAGLVVVVVVLDVLCPNNVSDVPSTIRDAHALQIAFALLPRLRDFKHEQDGVPRISASTDVSKRAQLVKGKVASPVLRRACVSAQFHA